MAMIFQDSGSALDPIVRIGKQFRELYKSHIEIDNDECDRRAIELLESVSLPNGADILRRYPHELSGGQLQRVYIAMALAQSTDIIILDEPTTFLDIKYQKSIMQLVRDLNKSLGITIIMVLHDINQALAYSDNIIALLDGKVIKNDQAANFFDETLLNRLYDADIKIEDGKVISW